MELRGRKESHCLDSHPFLEHVFASTLCLNHPSRSDTRLIGMHTQPSRKATFSFLLVLYSFLSFPELFLSLDLLGRILYHLNRGGEGIICI